LDGTSHKDYLVVFVAVKKLVAIDAVVSRIMKVACFAMPIHTPKQGFFGGDLTP